MKINRLFSIAAAALMMVACSSEETALKNNPAAGSQMPFTATIAVPGSGAGTRTAYTESGTDINVTWSVGDEIALIHNGVKDVATVKTINADGSATINGYVTGATNEADVQLYYPAARMISNGQGGFTFDPVIEGKKLTQDGTLKYIQGNLDFREGEGKLSVNGTEVTLKEPVNMAADNAIWKLMLKDETPADLNATQLAIMIGSDTIASTAILSTAASTVYLAVPGMADQAITIGATVGEDTYACTNEGVTLGAGKYYQSTVTMKVDPQAIPLTLEAITAGSVVVSNPKSGMQYSLNGGAKTAVTSDAITVEAGQKVAFYGNGTSIASYSGTVITGSGDGFKCKVYGNIMSLIDEENFATTTHSLTTSCFKSLFNSNSYLTDASGLLLPATTLAQQCYQQMFQKCTSLTTAPKLPATDLTNATYCYKQMFDGCTSLTTAPTLPAMTLAIYCYQGMFNGCTSLTTAPVLPATTLAQACYSQMFQGCTSLTTAPTLPATTMQTGCYTQMFSGCTSLTTAPTLPATTLANNCYQGMFYGCKGLTTAPALPAKTLAVNCYSSMFAGCSSLTTAPELPAKTLAGSCYKQMFQGCTGLTTAPEELPATTLPGGGNCYQQMFQSCTSLTATPKLPATSLTMNCYKQMFQGCTGLTKAYVKAAYTTSNSACTDMFKDCTNASTSTFYSDNAAGWKSTFPNNLGNWQAEAYPLTYPVALSAVTSDYVGSVVTTDGNVYATAKDATDAGKTAVAKICYVGTTGDATYNHGLALALADEGKMDWSTAGTTCSGKNTSTPITGAKWLLASKDQWNKMITAAGGYTALRDGFTSVGGSNLVDDYYWSSTEYENDSSYAWTFVFNNGSWGEVLKTTNYILVRACLAF